MIRWVFVIFIGLTILPFLIPELQKLGLWRLPGDIRFKVHGMLMCLPFGSTLLVSAIVFLLASILS